tara:strand:- start:576 stop:779 length:204 start_codon:yes stop_codon:yes gene_type:complete
MPTYTFEARFTEHGRLDVDAESFEEAKNLVEDAKDHGYDLSSSSQWSYCYDYTEVSVDYCEYDNTEA